ncbi:MAG: flagellar filament capping protein FliD, partial [bacterium]
DDSTAPFQLFVTADNEGLADAVSITHDATVKATVTGEVLCKGPTTLTQDTDDSDDTTFALRHIANAGTVTIKDGGVAKQEEITGISATALDTGGDLTADGVFSYIVTATIGGTETVRSKIFSVTAPSGGNDNSVTVKFDQVDGATSYSIYRIDDTQDGGNNIAEFADFTGLGGGSKIGTVADDGSTTFTFTDDTLASQGANGADFGATAEGDFTLDEATGAVVFQSAPSGEVTADYEYDLEFIETQAAKDAEIVLGEGSNAVTIKKSSNVITDVIEGVTLTLKKVDAVNPVKIDVTRNIFSVTGAVRGFFDSLNAAESFIDDASFFDTQTNASGPLFGNPNVLSIRTRISSLVISPVTSIPVGLLRSLSDLGVTLNPETGSFTFDAGELQTLLDTKADEVRNFFTDVTPTTDIDVEGLDFTDKTKTSASGGYAVKITQAAKRAKIEGIQDVSAGFTANESLTITSGGIVATAELTSGMSAATAVSTINSVFKDVGITKVAASFDSSTGKISLTLEDFGSKSSFTVSSSVANATSGTSGLGGTTAGTEVTHAGLDVKGTINGELAAGDGQILTGDSGTANVDGLRVKVKITATALALQGSSQGQITVSRGMASQLEEFLKFLTDTTQEGPIQTAIQQANDRIEDLQVSIDSITERAVREREKLLAQFTRLEQALGSLQTTSTFLDAQLKQIAATSTAIIARSGRRR